MSDYLAYQEKYRDEPRASDVELIRLISNRTTKGARVLDVGCSTGNLLRHLRAKRPDLELAGLDLDPAAVQITKDEGFAAAEWDITVQVPGDPLQDAVILNAVLYCLTDEQTSDALANIHRVLKPGGHLFIWDLLHPWNQRLTITEESERYGEPTYHIRPYKLLEGMAHGVGFSVVDFRPCKVPRLVKPDDRDDLTSWTHPPDWSRGGVAFRGGIAQPWCHAILTK